MRSIAPPRLFSCFSCRPCRGRAGPLRMEFANGYVTISAGMCRYGNC